MTTQEEYDEFQVEHSDRLEGMASKLLQLKLDLIGELEDLGLDFDNSNQLVNDMIE